MQIMCDAVHYIISAVGCGVCPNVTSNHSVTCDLTDIGTINNTLQCSMSVQTVVCDDIIGNKGNSLYDLKGIVFTITSHSAMHALIIMY